MSGKIKVLFLKDLYPYQEGQEGLMLEDYARGQFADFVEIISEKQVKAVSEAPANKSMQDKPAKKTK